MKINWKSSVILFISTLLTFVLVTVSLRVPAQQKNCPPRSAESVVVNFEDLSLAPNSYYNGADGAGGFTSQCTFFNNSYNQQYKSWSGWSYSNTTDTTTPGVSNQYSAYTGGGFRGSKNYGVAYTPHSALQLVTYKNYILGNPKL